MHSSFKKFVAVLLAIWLPLFSGSALATTVTMQAMAGDCPAMAKQANEHPKHHLAATDHHDQLVVNQDGAAGQHHQKNDACKDGSVCHFACSGYLAAVTAIQALEAQIFSQAYAISSTQFQSYTSAPLDPPPLARV